MLCLALGFVWAQHESDRALDRIFKSELAPAAELRTMEARLLAIHSRMQAVLLSQASPAGALALLEQERQVLRATWSAFRANHRNWSDDHHEDAAIADVEAALPDLERFLDRTAAAYRIYDPVDLTQLLETDWHQTQQALLYNLRNLSLHQEEHALAAQQELERSLQRTRLIVGSVLALGLLSLGYFAIRLGRYLMQRIADIEMALEVVAGGGTAVNLPHRPGETEMTRIAAAFQRTIAQIAADRSAIAWLMRQQQAIMASVAEGIYGVDAEGRVMFANRAALTILGYQEVEVLGRSSHELHHHHHADGRPYPLEDCPIAISRHTATVVRRDDEVFFRKDGTAIPVEYTSAPLLDHDAVVGGVIVFHDITERRRQERLLRQTVDELRRTNEQLTATQMQLLQAEKLAGLGQLAAGLAHEINNPIGFVNSNFGSLENYVRELFGLLDAYDALMRDLLDAGGRATALQLREKAELDFIRDDLDALIAETRQGLQRVMRIVADLRDFSRIDAPADWGEADLGHGLDSTLKVVAGPLLAAKAEVVRDYQPLPAVRCNAAQINQVFMNLLLNAAHALDGRGTITLRTRRAGDTVCVEVADTGCGMAPEVRQRMFDPFFTTKPVGQGTGLGLSVAYNVVRNHGGRFEVDSAPGQGTTVRLWLPVASPSAAAEPAPATPPLPAGH